MQGRKAGESHQTTHGGPKPSSKLADRIGAERGAGAKRASGNGTELESVLACAAMEPGGCVTHVERDGREITIVGTAHVSQKSVEEVRRVILDTKPDTVCVELDRGRHESLVDAKRFRKLNLFQVIRQKRVLYLLANLALSAYQKKIGDKIGVRPGAELLAAVESCSAVGAELVLADRDIQATLKRTWSNISFWNKFRLATSLLAAPFAIEEISEEQIERLKERDTISDMLSELVKTRAWSERALDRRTRSVSGKFDRSGAWPSRGGGRWRRPRSGHFE